MFRFGVVLTVVLIAIGLLVGGVLTGSLMLVYAAIGTSAVAGLLLVIGVTFRRDEIFGSSRISPEARQPEARQAEARQAEAQQAEARQADRRPLTAAASARGDGPGDRPAPGRLAEPAGLAHPAALRELPAEPVRPAVPSEPPARSARPAALREPPAEPVRPAVPSEPPVRSARPAALRQPPAEPVRPQVHSEPPARLRRPAAAASQELADRPASSDHPAPVGPSPAPDDAWPEWPAVGAAEPQAKYQGRPGLSSAVPPPAADPDDQSGQVPGDSRDRGHQTRGMWEPFQSARAGAAAAPAADAAGKPDGAAAGEPQSPSAGPEAASAGPVAASARAVAASAGPEAASAGAVAASAGPEAASAGAAKIADAGEPDAMQTERPPGDAPAGTAGTGPAGDAPSQPGARSASEAPSQPAEPDSGSRQAGHPPNDTTRGQVTIVPGIPRYHRSGCTLIRFLGADDLESMTREAAEADGCVPCRACQPDKSTADEPSQ